MDPTRTEENDDLTPEERAAFAALPRAQEPPAWLEETVVGALRAGGRIRATGPARRGALAAAALAAALVVFAAGLGVGRRLAGPGPAPGAAPAGGEPARWLLLLYEDGAYQPPASGQESSRVAEYAAWARSLAARGRLVAGEKLRETGAVLARAGDAFEVVNALPRAGEGVIAGYFVIEAPTPADAIAEARDCPHLKYGGRISLREIDPT